MIGALDIDDVPVGTSREIWAAVDRLVDLSPGVQDLRAHGLHLLAAAHRRHSGMSVPSELVQYEQAAAMRVLAAPYLLEKIRDSCDGPLVLFKGYEIAMRYPDVALRPFGDIDLLAVDAQRVHAQLMSEGFVGVGFDDAYYENRHHLRPLLLPDLPLVVEVHRRPEWVSWSRPPDAELVLEHSVPSGSGVDGLLAPTPSLHALLVAAHSWAGLPLRRLIDLVDSAILAREAPPRETEEWADRLDIGGLWRFTRRVQAAVLEGADPPAAARAWGRAVFSARDLTVLEQHARRLLAPFAVLPPHRAFPEAARGLIRDMTPGDGESWEAKLTRTRLAIRNAFSDRTGHDEAVARRRRS